MGFDDLSRQLAAPTSRRRALKAFGTAMGGAVAATLLKPFRSDAACPAGTTPCGTNCCGKGIACLSVSQSRCGCQAGAAVCGSGCCAGTCSDPATSCCCPSGSTPCGPTCCASGVACIDPSIGFCGCPSGTTPCGHGDQLTCCPAGQSCSSGCPKPTSPVKNCRTCGPVGTPCTSNNQCCNGNCDPRKAGGSCACITDNDCPANSVCGAGICFIRCSSDADCPTYSFCYDVGPGGTGICIF